MSNEQQLDSLLTREFVEDNIRFEKKSREEGRSSIAKMVVGFHSGEGIVVYLPDLPNDGDKKRMILYRLGIRLRAENGCIREALFISEAWMTNSTNPGYDKITPSEHPAREEVIIIVGRNEEKTLSIMAIQPFSRDSEDAPVWKELRISISEDKSEQTYEGILDDFFAGAAQVTAPEMKA
jgi:hypothetical protein